MTVYLQNLSYQGQIVGNIDDEESTAFTAMVGKIHPVDVSSGTVTVTPPSTPLSGDNFTILDSRSNAASNNITIDFVTATQNFHGISEKHVIITDKVFSSFIYLN